MKEKEGHYYICIKCGCFYKIVNGKQIRQEQCELKKTTENNFHIAEKHKCIKQQITAREHGVNKKKSFVKKK